MEKNIKGFLAQLIAAYHELNTQLEENIRTANQKYRDQSREQVYTDEYLQTSLNQTIAQAMKDFLAQATELNAQAKQRIAAVKENHVGFLTKVDKSPDYAVRISNALAFLQVEGPEVTDETSAQILKDFLGDVETMQLFRRVVERQKGEKLTDAYGKTTFPLTFGQLEKQELFMVAMAELEDMADHIFLRQKTETEVEHLRNGVKLYVPMDGYSQQVGELSILEQAGTVEAMAAELTGAKN